jgi:hypothetical protein
MRYRLTEKGIALALALVEIVLWAARYEKTDTPASILRAMRSNRARFIADIRKRWESGHETHPPRNARKRSAAERGLD